MKVLLFGASLRKDSFNHRLAQAAATILREHPDITVDLARFREFEMPVYDGDLEDASGIPAGANALIERIRAADALVISTPEYNGSISGAFKNAIDWISRATPMPLKEKPVLLLGASPGGFAAIRGLGHARIPLETVGAYVYPAMFGVAKAHEAYDESGKLSGPAYAKLEDLLKAYTVFARSLIRANESSR